ncbi:RING-H2 finger protein like [Heracleum sosnowskyi]|uniref:RING-H2 finger protein like n=1 Tax=Heracleum sosnowskyi TaxID=360622 RepID=A0AAD8HVH6_9APIA|nr:RING-H2 finger protein like [Heracleum sosnowskyi]
MDFLKLFLSLFLVCPLTFAANDCPFSMCGNYVLPIRFPFRLASQQPQNCGYPGFDLHCNSTDLTVLNLPSGDFVLRSINYRAQVVQLYDPYKCLPKRLMELNLSGSPFKAAYYQNYTFLSCPPESTTSRFTSINCLSNSTSTTLATSSMNLAISLTMCKIIVTLPIPVSRPEQLGGDFTSDLGDDLQLTWDIPNCDDCEANGGSCAFKSSTSQETTCFYNFRRGTKGISIFKIIALCIALPAIAASMSIAIFMCLMDRRRLGVHPNNIQHNSNAAAIAPVVVISTPGLDEGTIESYTKVILGESRRLPGPNNITCPICLSDYHAKETLRCIPECQHCFHADCIDEWLRLKGSCPVCRNSPLPAAHAYSQ